jgi:hypothetical protein
MAETIIDAVKKRYGSVATSGLLSRMVTDRKALAIMEL